MTEPLTRDAIEFALACDPAVPGNGRICQELLAALLQRAITRPPAPWPMPVDRIQRAPWTNARLAKYRATCAAKRERVA